MKFNKKIAVPVLSTVMSLSLIGGVAGAVAWYQYNSRVTASFVGSSVANTSVLQIGTDGTNGIDWGRDRVFGTTANDNKLLPVTFGQLEQDDALPAKAYHTPEAGAGNYGAGWEEATAGVEYVQFKIYLRAYASDASEQEGYKQVEKDVYLSEVILEDAADSQADVSEALRVHIAVKDGNNFLISENKIEGLELSGPLNLDMAEGDDTKGGYAWENVGHRDDELTYGNEGDTQDTLGIADIVQEKTDGYMPDHAHPTDKLICTTPESGEVEIVVTVWLEGWHQFGSQGQESAIWNPFERAGTEDDPAAIHVGLKFDTGKAR